MNEVHCKVISGKKSIINKCNKNKSHMAGFESLISAFFFTDKIQRNCRQEVWTVSPKLVDLHLDSFSVTYLVLPMMKNSKF